jgi:hypothetical protein
VTRIIKAGSPSLISTLSASAKLIKAVFLSTLFVSSRALLAAAADDEDVGGFALSTTLTFMILIGWQLLHYGSMTGPLHSFIIPQ